MKNKKKNQTVNNKFNFDNDYIIGVSSSNSNSTEIKKQKKKKKSKKESKMKNYEQNKKVSKPKNYEQNTKEKRAKKPKGIVIKAILIIMLFVGAGCFLCLSPAFNVEQILVENNKKLSSETISSLSKIELYKNIFLMRKSDVIENIEKNPYINTVKISRKLPNKVKIFVEERTEKYLVEFGEGKYAIIDGQGYILEITSQKIEGLPILVGIKTPTDQLINIKDNSARLKEEDLKKLDVVASIVETAKNYEVFDYITKIDISDSDDYKFTLEEEQKVVYFGSNKDINTKIQYMKEILNNEKGKRGEIFLNRELTPSKPPFFRESVN